MRVLCSLRKPMRKKPVSGFPSAVLSLAGSHAQKSSGVEIGFRLSLFRKKKARNRCFFFTQEWLETFCSWETQPPKPVKRPVVD